MRGITQIADALIVIASLAVFALCNANDIGSPTACWSDGVHESGTIRYML